MNKVLIIWLSLVFFLTAISASADDNPAPPVKRIVALAPHIVENLYAIGAGERIVGTVEYADFPAEANQIPRIGGFHGIALEKLLALSPDLVIAWQGGNQQGDLEKLEQLGLKVVYSETKELQQIPQSLRWLGRLTGREEHAEQVALHFEQGLAKLQARYRSAAPVSVFYQLWPAPMMTVNGTTWIHQTLEVCGASNVFADAATAYPQISIENVLHTGPQVIVIPHEKSKKAQPKIDWYKWPEIPAAKHQQYIEVNADLLHRYTSRVLEGLSGLCDKLDASRTYYQKLTTAGK
ncbi:cobalamin-binding protein [Pseudoalteromonas sp. OOF1S-7]|uniref:cobalamin-binding protein n=1 Tax=Pseudoalteromonas sp. OOF1S-7 TaxID=2917757 RepID=UPI001EF6FBB2|nr:cobalamin-binding protein [Pseudoalteromonas sp. OOF1S-7]MCG7535326.1 cobalamin-binding protein [Pseudoalteromonas sp. OOF1S-7]